jgi:hypothetical protein
VNSGALEGLEVPGPLVVSVVLLLCMNKEMMGQIEHICGTLWHWYSKSVNLQCV